MVSYVNRIFVFLVTFRILNAVLCRTAFVPDEPWQSMEVAHRMVFGYAFDSSSYTESAPP